MDMIRKPIQPAFDLPAGAPIHPNSGPQFFLPLQQLATKSIEQRREDMEEVNAFFNSRAVVVPAAQQQAIKDTILAKARATNWLLFGPVKRTDNPDVTAKRCNRATRCKHYCDESDALVHDCGAFCTEIKEYTRDCGHQTHIMCCRKESYTQCREKCMKVIDCGHKCRKTCHYPSECEPACVDFYCQAALKEANRLTK